MGTGLVHSRIATETRKRVTVREEGWRERERERKRKTEVCRCVELLSSRLSLLLPPAFFVFIDIKGHCIFYDISIIIIIITSVLYNIK